MKNEKLLQVRNLYFNTTMSQAQIADLIGISQKTVSLYITQNNWKLLKKRGTQLPSVFIEQMNCELQQMNNLIASRPDGQRFPTLQEAEIRRKIMYSISTIKERQSAGAQMEAFMNLLHFAARDNRADALVISTYIQDFLKVEYNLPNDPPDKRYDLAGNPLPSILRPTRHEFEEDDEDDMKEHNQSPQLNNTNLTINPSSPFLPTEASAKEGVVEDVGRSPLLPADAFSSSAAALVKEVAKEGITANEGASPVPKNNIPKEPPLKKSKPPKNKRSRLTKNQKPQSEKNETQNATTHNNPPQVEDEPAGLMFICRNG